MADRMPLPRLHRPPGTSQGLPRFRGPATAAIRPVPYPDIPNELWLLLDGPTISLPACWSFLVPGTLEAGRPWLAPHAPRELLPRLGAELQC
jgi:hypothetical protein